METPFTPDEIASHLLGCSAYHCYIYADWNGFGLDAYLYSPMWQDTVWEHYTLVGPASPANWNRAKAVHYEGNKADSAIVASYTYVFWLQYTAQVIPEWERLAEL